MNSFQFNFQRHFSLQQTVIILIHLDGFNKFIANVLFKMVLKSTIFCVTGKYSG